MPIPYSILVLLLGNAFAPAADPVPHGRYVEARTASVFAGACHYGAERTTSGREALLGWHFEGGRHAGVDLAGVDVAVAIAGEKNLAEPGGARRALVYVSEKASRAQVEAAVGLLRERHGALLGQLEPARTVALEITFDGTAYAARAPGLFDLRGATLPDRACCKMPQDVWYRPFENASEPLVGHNERFRFDDARLGTVWSRSDENASFTGGFRFAPVARATPAACAPSVSRAAPVVPAAALPGESPR